MSISCRSNALTRGQEALIWEWKCLSHCRSHRQRHLAARGGRKPGSVVYHAAMLFLLSPAVRALARLVIGSRRDDRSKDLEILVLRHQLRVLRRTNPHLTLQPLD